MEPLSLATIFLCVWVLINYWLLPFTRDRWTAADLRKKLLRAGTLVTLESVRDISAIGLVTLAGIVLLVWIASAFSGVSFAAPAAIVDSLASLYGVVKIIGEEYASMLGLLGLFGAIVVLYSTAKHARNRITNIWSEKTNEVLARVIANPSELGNYATNPELKALAERCTQLMHLLDQNETAS
ncbi:MAG: hypothetical protein HY255_06700, partial [Betaproteobacteria bacterium]|nr:hypothetical protein [Betaproteobacteria bacterium]